MTRRIGQSMVDGSTWIREERLDAGLSQLELAEKVGCSGASISVWERGCWNPSDVKYLSALQRVLLRRRKNGKRFR